jgi:ankyrin repeat protein/mono/diheme cytochrome c family protein
MGHRAPQHAIRSLAFLAVLGIAPAGAASGAPLLAQAPSPSSGGAAVQRSGTTHSIPIDQMPFSPGLYNDALFRAVQAGDAEMVRRLLAKGASPAGGLLLKAIKEGKPQIARLLLEAGARADDKDDQTRTALIYAARDGHAEIVQMLLAKGANPNARNDFPRVFTLHGPSPHLARDNYMSALMYAAQGGHTQIVATLAAAGAKVNAVSYYDETALMYAADKGRTDTVVKLLELGADLQASADSREKKIEATSFGYSYGGTALLYAVRGKQAAAAKVLLAETIRRNKRIDDGESVYYYALFAGDAELVRILAGRGIDTRKAYFLPAAARGSSPEIFEFLLDRVPEAEIRGGRLDPSVLTSAADGKSLVKVRMVLERGANINARDSRGQNALYYAVYQGASDVVGYLLDKGIEVNVTGDISLGTSNQGDTALAMAVQKGQLDMVKQLLARGADVNLKRTSGKSALEVAKEIGRTDVLLLLSSSGRIPADSSPAYLRGKSVYRFPEKLEAGVRFRSGGLLYLANCAECHRADGTGNGKSLSLGQERLQGKAKPALIAALMQGIKVSNYVAMEESQSKMLDAEIAALLAYVNDAWGKNPDHDFQPADVQAQRTAAPTRAQDPVIGSGERVSVALQELDKLGYLYSESVFVEAVRQNDRKAVELFLAAGMNPAAKNAKGQTASFVAAWNDNAELLGLLLDGGVDIHLKNAPWGGSQSAAWAATESCRGDKGKAMRVLLDKGLDPKFKQADWTLLMRAASNGCAGTARVLIERGAEVNARLNSGQTALKLANSYARGSDVIAVLIAAGAKE